MGAEFRAPGGRGLLTNAIVGYHGKPDRRLDVTPKLDKSSRMLTLTVKPSPARSSPAGTKATKASAVASSADAAGRKKRRYEPGCASAVAVDHGAVG
ncbi:hypothetical protein [Nocardia vaccinii]|uniref:hypothetical protein n=1 Tax=Nocardia vaccinii TaxID=1822 RepID=UPI000AA67CEA|nr:hypothetical protein [Nocardia vaccinii]